jgi:hypothetical protein
MSFEPCSRNVLEMTLWVQKRVMLVQMSFQPLRLLPLVWQGMLSFASSAALDEMFGAYASARRGYSQAACLAWLLHHFAAPERPSSSAGATPGHSSSFAAEGMSEKDCAAARGKHGAALPVADRLATARQQRCNAAAGEGSGDGPAEMAASGGAAEESDGHSNPGVARMEGDLDREEMPEASGVLAQPGPMAAEGTSESREQAGVGVVQQLAPKAGNRPKEPVMEGCNAMAAVVVSEEATKDVAATDAPVAASGTPWACANIAPSTAASLEEGLPLKGACADSVCIPAADGTASVAPKTDCLSQMDAASPPRTTGTAQDKGQPGSATAVSMTPAASVYGVLEPHTPKGMKVQCAPLVAAAVAMRGRMLTGNVDAASAAEDVVDSEPAELGELGEPEEIGAPARQEPDHADGGDVDATGLLLSAMLLREYSTADASKFDGGVEAPSIQLGEAVQGDTSTLDSSSMPGCTEGTNAALGAAGPRSMAVQEDSHQAPSGGLSAEQICSPTHEVAAEVVWSKPTTSLPIEGDVAASPSLVIAEGVTGQAEPKGGLQVASGFPCNEPPAVRARVEQCTPGNGECATKCDGVHDPLAQDMGSDATWARGCESTLRAVEARKALEGGVHIGAPALPGCSEGEAVGCVRKFVEDEHLTRGWILTAQQWQLLQTYRETIRRRYAACDASL